ncbi:MOS1T transposase, partial [Pseudoatta argentina]
MNRTSVFKWCREFKNGRTSVHDDQRSGRPSILTDDIVENIENALRDDRRLTVDELSAMFPQISRSLLHETITETLGYRKLSARWVPKQLTDQHKLNRVEAGQEFLRRYKLHGDETWMEKIKTYLETLKWEVLPHPPYSPDIAPSDFHLFRSMAHGLADRRFHSYEEAQKWIDSWIASKDMSFFRRGIHVLPERWEKVVSSDGQYLK